MKVRPTMTPKEEATWLQRVAPPTPTACPVRRVYLSRNRPVPVATVRKPRHRTEHRMGWCKTCVTRTEQIARYTYDPVSRREDMEVTCRRCLGIVVRRSVVLGGRR